jgi:transposase
LTNFMTRRSRCRILIWMVFAIFLRPASPSPCGQQNRVTMSMQAEPGLEVPGDTARIARRAFRKGSLAIRARNELGSWYQDSAFAAAYGVRGKQGISPAQLAVLTVLQFAENLTGQQEAADAMRGLLDWKCRLGVSLDDEGFDFSVLSEFLARLAAGDLERTVLDLFLARLKGLGLVSAGGWQRTNSTHVPAAVRGMNRLELGRETVRAALEALAAATPGWLAGVIDASWQQVYGQRVDNLRLQPRGRSSCPGQADVACHQQGTQAGQDRPNQSVHAFRGTAACLAGVGWGGRFSDQG